MKFKINCIPPSYNGQFKINFNMREVYLSKEAKEFKKIVGLYTPKLKYDENDLFKLKVYIHNNWYYKNGKVKRQDIQNMDKLLIDAMCKKLGFDDCRIWDSRFIKIQDDKEMFTEIELLPYSITDNATLFK